MGGATPPHERTRERAARIRGLTAQDAEFVVAARELGVRLATADKGILGGARDVAVEVGEG